MKIKSKRSEGVHENLERSRGTLARLVFDMLNNQHPVRLKLSYPFVSLLDTHYNYHENISPQAVHTVTRIKS